MTQQSLFFLLFSILIARCCFFPLSYSFSLFFINEILSSITHNGAFAKKIGARDYSYERFMYFIIVDHHRRVARMVGREEMKETELNGFYEKVIIFENLEGFLYDFY